MTPRMLAVLALLLVSACIAGETSVRPDASSSTPAPSAASPTGSDASDDEGSPLEGAWRDVTEAAGLPTGEWTNKVEVADLDLDGDVDLLFANGGDYDTAGEPVPSRVYFNDGDGTFTEASDRVLGKTESLARVAKVADLNADGLPDVVLGVTYNSQSRLFLGGPDDTWRDATRTHLPTAKLSVGDLEPADVDGDLDLDLVIADWGNRGPVGPGGRVRVWLNDGTGRFTDGTANRMPRTLARFSWDLEAVDVDNDWDLDVAVSCKFCPTSLLFINDGRGHFADVTSKRMPAHTNNYEFAPIDLDADGFLDLVTVNDGEMRSAGLAEHVFHNDGTGAFTDVTDEWWPAADNRGWDDNVVVGHDVDSDGDADFLIGSLDGPDRLLINDGSGHLQLYDDVFAADPTYGTLGMAIVDLTGDGVPDVVESQGEVPGNESERMYLGTDVLGPDTAPPVVRAERRGGFVYARVHDNRTPNMPHDWRSIEVSWGERRSDLTWYGENLFRAGVPASTARADVCAVDAAGNETCLAAR